ncbi:F-box/WD repeat-containing protein 1A [Lachnellula occidentalis]|uniref:F-box/WD repeat-containing protein 1A n=1 Tax=Lachnellula occidentalis TaxID=215460 RepID=A0A8H8U8G2_9HELO|nr:F-box/WD repeat-containing protein 1A [Lachnellula occidentalis]
MASYEQSPQDEGYSEDPLTVGTASAPVPPWLASMDISERTEYVMSIIDHLPTSKVCEIVQRLRPRIYIDFFQYLPTEVNLKILGFLDPVSLIHTAQASREWMLLAVDRKLWEHLYILEGFRVIHPEVLKFEAAINTEKSRSSGSSEEEHASKRRATPQRILHNLQLDEDFEMVDADMVAPTQSSIFGPLTTEPKDTRAKESSLDPDVQMASPRPMSSPKISKSTGSNYPGRSANASQSHRNHRLSTASTLNYPHVPPPVSPMSSLVVVDRSDGRKKLNWQYLYSQRRKLEANWETEKYTNFQLPHPMHPQEAHEECIYTIQHSGKYLVSGSRDKTLRIWNLNTQRLVKPPLRAHTGSVLCLQFDANPEEDLIVSGSSDATVVLWRFSTGQIIQRLRKAHRESVLNVRFDKRVLVTCSKDKTIKIFNRRPMEPGESGYPETQGVSPVPIHLNNYGMNPTPYPRLPTLPAYSMLGCLYGHGAAVNAVQIFGDEVVSASGDRTVKVWNWPERTCTRTLIGHSKGIACVQYDGRRIVSGSSDNEVKVFDKESGLEVASLRAHSNLVRTVQAGFGDLPYSSEEDQVEAKQIDNEYFKAIDSGTLTAQQGYQRGRPKNAGSRKPEDITAYGAKLPPGGGGGRFGRIVSGSYDETIIIWRRDKEGVWRAQHTLRQEEAAHMASNAVAREAVEREATARAAENPPSEDVPYLPILPKMPNSPQNDAVYRQVIEMTVSQGPTALRTALRDYPPTMTFRHLGDTISALEEGTTKHVMTSVALTAIHEYQQQQAQQASGGPSEETSGPDESIESAAAQVSTGMAQDPSPRPATQAQASSSQQPVTTPMDTTTTTSTATATATTTAPAPQTQPPTAATIIPPAAHHHHHHLTNNMARVFKLQFDARRIICCSQTTVIVGWDFANGDESIIEASRFFAPVE